MDITHLIESLREDLLRAAEVGGDEARATAERLLLALDPALRLTLTNILNRPISGQVHLDIDHLQMRGKPLCLGPVGHPGVGQSFREEQRPQQVMSGCIAPVCRQRGLQNNPVRLRRWKDEAGGKL